MLPQETIRRKRNGEHLAPAEIADFVRGLSDGSISEGQVAAFAMAIWFSGMSREETVALTLAMRDSGETLDWSTIRRPIADKHSTGGVGDNVSLMLAPIVAACGLAVPMISGRGLGHTGGTLDKLESIPGYDIQPSASVFRRTVDEIGCAIIGQTANLAPADKRLYAIRDVTATVDSVPLITASILSKKLAAGLQSLVLDVKLGNGSFMSDAREAEILARSLVDVANGAGVRTSALLTDMNEPLADAAGNALEIDNCLAFLRGEKKERGLKPSCSPLPPQCWWPAALPAMPNRVKPRRAKCLAAERRWNGSGRWYMRWVARRISSSARSPISDVRRSFCRSKPRSPAISPPARRGNWAWPSSRSAAGVRIQTTGSITAWVSTR